MYVCIIDIHNYLYINIFVYITNIYYIYNIYIYMYIFISIDHLAVRVTVMISAVIYVFLDRRWFFKPLSYETFCDLLF